jgi:thymidine kinase
MWAVVRMDLYESIPALQHSERTGLYVPGDLDLFVGPMKSGKTEGMLYHLNRARYSHTAKFQLFKPLTDTRVDPCLVYSRQYGTMPCQSINPAQPGDILSYVGKDIQLIGIDEAQFFAPELSEVVMALRKAKRHVLCSFLDTDFRGEPFPTSTKLLSLYANRIEKLHAVCDVQPCSIDATMTQRLINGQPAHYEDPIILIEKEGQSETYEARCIYHHAVDRTPRQQ